MTSSQEQFSASLISQEVQATLPDSCTLRPLKRSDFHRGHLDVLRGLTHVGDISEAAWTERFDWMKSCHGTYYTVVIVDESREESKSIVGTGTLLVEKKFLYELGTQGHIEDIAISSDMQGKKFGVKLIKALDHIGKEVGCYKSILDCSPKNAPFYEKCDYEKAGQEMHHYYDPKAQEYSV
ncbi:acyl-CoA N-acyltransferase [Mollisia scopiformis]|uniref:Glucosamine 6-phosphate N-acetyltransferase n=1 Tax=Mollisia scopiformis TaxID=149040 RepID=A0A132B897_MOLSC|nr:acyl-CoA N-acyltransferase [Mollisia scopiformis]KUJ08622.1 acyl-CoA N-acyltransferase [Mollisia scopiformis]